MSTPLEYAASLASGAASTTPGASTGPRTQEGKARAAQNATTHGLYSTDPRLSPEELQTKTDLTIALLSTLNPANPFEQTFTDEIVRAAWRLKRCAAAEDLNLETDEDSVPQTTIDRARAQAHNILLKATAELRRLQTNRRIGFEIYPEGSDLALLGLATHKEIVTAITANHRRLILADKVPAQDSSFCKTPETPENIEKIDGETDLEDAFDDLDDLDDVEDDAELPDDTIQIARNSPCPCRSGEKYKRCCGKDAPPLLHQGAKAA